MLRKLYEKKILFICGSRNQTTQMHKIAQELDSDYDCWFTPYYATGVEEVLRMMNLTEMSIMGSKMVGRCLQVPSRLSFEGRLSR